MKLQLAIQTIRGEHSNVQIYSRWRPERTSGQRFQVFRQFPLAYLCFDVRRVPCGSIGGEKCHFGTILPHLAYYITIKIEGRPETRRKRDRFMNLSSLWHPIVYKRCSEETLSFQLSNVFPLTHHGTTNAVEQGLATRPTHVHDFHVASAPASAEAPIVLTP
ncbi:hypothetical protein ABKN59_008199 [Abortiporus biennis]